VRRPVVPSSTPNGGIHGTSVDQLEDRRSWPSSCKTSTAHRPNICRGDLGITVVGVVFLFLCNGGGQGKDFLYRYFPLAVVVGWKFVVAMVVAAWALNQVLAGQPEHVTRWSVVALGQHLKALNRRVAV
jgi:hypothetical protein